MRVLLSIAASLFGLFTLTGCQGSIDDLSPKATKPLPAKIVQKMKAKGMAKNSPIHLRLFKDEHVVEVWKQKTNGKFEMIQNYSICAWSGTLGPKFKEGDRQAPEGFYAIKPPQMNPASQYYLSINTGFPNAYDRAQGRSGAHLMLHGACSSSGCYSLTDDNISEVFAFARDSFAGGQQEIILEALPFRMTPEKMAIFAAHKDFKFWQMLREGYDAFELTKIPPKVDFCEKKYVFNRVADTGSFNVNAACPPSKARWPQLTPVLASYDSKFQSSFAQASKRFEGVPFPVVMGGKSRPLDKKWKPQPVKSGPTANALIEEAERAARAKLKADAKAAAELAAATPADTSIQGNAAAPAGDAASVVPVPETKASADAAKPVATEPAADANAKITPLTQEQSSQTDVAKAADGSVVPVPAPNPNAVAAETPAEPAKKKRRFWPFNGS